ncbi:hypothetical protein P167DRAFT_115431 [Morchella conica CCBAS932]|uniref:F-box domain-containing protein n=1 Tax=Morchella conica CCBAS932 TaxID=1392247 RepID=A0A3N4KSH3_9PEZI|nr:hypothetical protein P167DRAFT_115431 [Morchella conica CCBAS932]
MYVRTIIYMRTCIHTSSMHFHELKGFKNPSILPIPIITTNTAIVPMSLTMNPRSIRTKNFYDLPRGIAVHIFSFLPLTALLGAQLVSKRFYVLTSGEEFKHCFFLSPPLSSLLPSTEVFLHPVFGRLNFSAYHSPKVIRIGEDLDSLSLYKAKVGKQFATYPALKNVVLRVLSGGIWSFSTEIKVENDDGVTVWDVINESTTFFKSYTKVSFADHFGLDVCEERGYDPKVLMQNYDFLDPKM